MSSPVINELAASTLNRKWILEVNTGTIAAPIWSPVGGVKAFQPVTDDAQWEDDGRFSDGGYGRQTKTDTNWSATCTVARAPLKTDLTTYDAAQEFLRLKAEGKFGPANQVDVRFYEFDPDPAAAPRVQAYKGTAGVGYAEGSDKLASAEVTLTGQGKLLPISHPYPAAAQVPQLSTFTPTPPASLAAVGGTPFRITGSRFTGTTGVTIGGTAATSFTVWSDVEITGVAAAHAAGDNLPVVVTNATGASSGGPVAKYA